MTSMSCKLEPVIWPRDTGQQIHCFDRCQLIITWMSNTKEVHSKPRLHVSLSTCYLEYGRHVARLRRRRRRAYAPTSNTASHDNHEKINSWVSFCFPDMGCLWGSAYGAPLRAAGAPLKRGASGFLLHIYRSVFGLNFRFAEFDTSVICHAVFTLCLGSFLLQDMF